jgi:nucleotide sugar dehydrogenase
VIETTTRYSFNPLTGTEVPLPETLDDKIAIDSFLENHPRKKVVVVQGLGFVGAVMSIVCANALTEDYAVIGVDLANGANYWKIKSINEGSFPIVASDPKIETYYQQSRHKGNFLATYDAYAYSKADVIIVDINLDVAKDSNEMNDLAGYEVDLSPFKKAMQAIGTHCNEEVLILVETTVPPGTCKKVVKPIIEKNLSSRGLSTEKYKLGHSYERVMPGPNYVDSIQNFYRVFAGIDDKSAVATEKFLRTIISTEKYPLTRLGNTNATEMAKVLENSFRAMNIAFMVEWTRFAEEAGVNIYEVVKAIRMRPTHKNIMLPGMGVGGYCLTKDPLLASWSKQNLFEGAHLTQSEKGVTINDKMPVYAFEYLRKNIADLNDKKVLLLGVSYRQDVGDTRYTPVEIFYNCLERAEANIVLHDPHIPYWEEKKLKVAQDHKHLLKQQPDIIVISTGHSDYKSDSFIKELLEMEKTFIYDTIGIYTDIQLEKLLTKHQVKVLGRGDM